MSHRKQFVSFEKLEKGSHVILFYEDVKRARSIRAEFIEAGLSKGQTCVYITTENDAPRFEQKLVEKGINVTKAKAKKQFQVYKIPDPFTDFGFQTSLHKIWDKITTTHKSPLRIACNIVGDVSRLSDEEINDLITTENCVNKDFAKSEDYLLCTYHLGTINEKSRRKAFSFALKNHHAAIFAPEGNIGTAFYL